MSRARLASIAAACALSHWLASQSAAAEGLAVRGPNLGQSVVFVEGAPESSRAVWIRPWLAITQEWRSPYDAVGLGLGLRHTIVGGPRGWGLDAQMAAGWLVTTLLPGVAFTLAPSTHVRARTEGFWFSMGIAAPMAVRLNAPQALKVPVQGELWLAFRAGPVWLGAMTAIGASFSETGAASLVMQGAGYIAIPFGDGHERR
jgi:hypothetical protein